MADDGRRFETTEVHVVPPGTRWRLVRMVLRLPLVLARALRGRARRQPTST